MKKYYAVIDTNVIVSSMLRRDSIPGEIVNLVGDDQIVPLLNEDILGEYAEVLGRNKFGFTNEDIVGALETIREKGIFLERSEAQEAFVDEDDAVFFEICLSGRSSMNAYLITGNLRHYPIRSYVVTPREMLEIIERERAQNQ